jgi:hypothetical protein
MAQIAPEAITFDYFSAGSFRVFVAGEPIVSAM